MATRQKSTLSLNADDDNLLSAAGEMLFLHRADVVRLALRGLLRELDVKFFDLAAMRAHRLFIDKAWTRWGMPFQDVDFRRDQIQQWLRAMNTDIATDEIEVIPNNLVNLSVFDPFGSAFDKYRTDENPCIIAARARNRRAFMNSPSGPDLDFFKLVFQALRTTPSNSRSEAAKQEVRATMRKTIQTEYLVVITKFRAIPKLIINARALGATQEFLTNYRNDPETLAEFVINERTRRDCGLSDDAPIETSLRGASAYNEFLSD